MPTTLTPVYAMLDYAQSGTCRRILFARYFDEPPEAAVPCGVCDNCVEPPATHDTSYAAWQTVCLADEVHRHGGRVTLAALADLARGLGGGQYKMADERGRPSAATARIDLASIGGKLDLSREVRFPLAH